MKELLGGKLSRNDAAEADGIFFVISCKGSHKRGKAFVTPRKPHRRGEEIEEARHLFAGMTRNSHPRLLFEMTPGDFSHPFILVVCQFP